MDNIRAGNAALEEAVPGRPLRQVRTVTPPMAFSPERTDCASMTPDMMKLIREQRLGFVATVNADNTLNLSPTWSFEFATAVLESGQISCTNQNLFTPPKRSKSYVFFNLLAK